MKRFSDTCAGEQIIQFKLDGIQTENSKHKYSSIKSFIQIGINHNVSQFKYSSIFMDFLMPFHVVLLLENFFTDWTRKFTSLTSMFNFLVSHQIFVCLEF